MSSHRGGDDPAWFGRDHVLVIQAAANLDAPEYAHQLWETADDPEKAALELLNMLVRDRAGSLS